MEFGTFSPSLETLAKLVAGLDSSLGTMFTAPDGNDDAIAREIIAMARRVSGVELALAVRVLSLLVAMLQVVHGGGGDERVRDLIDRGAWPTVK